MKGILFKPWKIKFIAEHPDMEIQTRRVIKPQPIDRPTQDAYEWWHWVDPKGMGHDKKSRYQVGEVVYIKEAWALDRYNYSNAASILYKGHVSEPKFPTKIVAWNDDLERLTEQGLRDKDYRWHSPMMMFAWAARYFIRITGVRAERLQEITFEDVKAEGVTDTITAWGHKWTTLWDSINPKYPWGSNPWVFAYEFMAHFASFEQ